MRPLTLFTASALRRNQQETGPQIVVATLISAVALSCALGACGSDGSTDEEEPPLTYECPDGVAEEFYTFIKTEADAKSFADSGCTIVPAQLFLCEGATGPLGALRSAGLLMMGDSVTGCPDPQGAAPNLEGLEGITELGGLDVVGTTLATLNGLSSLRQVGDFLLNPVYVGENAQLRDITGLNGIETVRGGICIENNPLVPQDQIDVLAATVAGCTPPQP